MKNRRMRTRMYGGVRGRKTKKVGRNSKIFVFLLLDLLSWVSRRRLSADFFASWQGEYVRCDADCCEASLQSFMSIHAMSLAR